jgi:hypothetical protein
MRKQDGSNATQFIESQLIGLPPAFMLSLLDPVDGRDMFL